MKTLDVGISEEPIVCTLTDAERVDRGEELSDLFEHKLGAVRELDDGYALHFPGDDATARELLAFIAGERACCLFFTFELHFEPSQGGIWLGVRGPEGTKDMVRRMARLD